MGVSGLWTELEPAHSITTWSQLSDSHCRANKGGHRGLRVGIDLSLWLCHVEKMDQIGMDEEGNSINAGKNADLRCIFYRICRLLQRGILAIFIFDGPQRPSWKRGKYIGKNSPFSRHDHELKEMFRLMGMEWRIAAGEAEAELAEMTVRGEIDAVLSDDVDNFLFGAKMVVRNMSKTLSANKSKVALKRKATLPETSNSSSPMKRTNSFDPSLSTQYEDVPAAFDRALVTFSYEDILTTTGLCREDMILVALMSGGDYSEGIKGCGVTTAKKLAEAGFGRKLLNGIKVLEKDQNAQRDFLRDWREEVAEVLRTNPSKLLSKKDPKLADKILESDEFPSLKIVNNYAAPRVSRIGSYDPPTWDHDIDIEGLIDFVSSTFEWGNEQIISKFRNNLWVGILMRQIRRTALEQDDQVQRSLTTLSPSELVQSVINFKCESSTDFTPSYSLHLESTSFDTLINPFLPHSDPYPFPLYDLYSEEQAEILRAERKSQGRAVEKPQEPKTGTFRHWIPVGFVAIEEGCRMKVKEWREGKNRKERAKEEMEERKAERARAKAEGRSSPVKKKAIRPKKSENGGGSGVGRKKEVESSASEAEESEEKEASKVMKARQEKKLAEMRKEALAKGKGKGKEGGKDSGDVFGKRRPPTQSTSITLESSDIEIVDSAPSNSRLRTKSNKSRSPPFNLHSTFNSSKSTSGVSSKKTPPTLSTSIFPSTSTKTSHPDKPPPQARRTIRPPPSDSDSDTDDAPPPSSIPSTSKHLDKSNRLSKAHSSPRKTRPQFIELSSDEEEEELESLDEILNRRSKEISSVAKGVDIEQGQERVKVMPSRRRGEKKKEEVETLVLSD